MYLLSRYITDHNYKREKSMDFAWLVHCGSVSQTSSEYKFDLQLLELNSSVLYYLHCESEKTGPFFIWA